VAGLHPSPGTAAYGAAQAGLVHLTHTLGVEFGPRVRVNCVSASPAVPASNVADAVLFLASPRAGYVSGTELVVHGGGDRPAYLDAL
jgi:NAD(P)-dependent dehydrogenase (short-subunit alcohol dehydrogenase family)